MSDSMKSANVADPTREELSIPEAGSALSPDSLPFGMHVCHCLCIPAVHGACPEDLNCLSVRK
ncbi:MAG: hypothetical protein AAF212_04150 [Verrucomicrobiota bacterium]